MSNEFSLIKRIINLSNKSILKQPQILVPPGDDAALLKSLKYPVISTDTQRENVHFKLDWFLPDEIGRKAVAVTLSDLAASYAEPAAIFINLGLPDYISENFVEKLYEGINDSLKIYNCGLGGGNITSGNELSIDLFAIGNGDENLFPLRSNAKPSDGLYVTGPMGLARAGLDAIQNSRNNCSNIIEYLKNPKARFDAAKILKDNNISCVMDISDGLAGDAKHIAEASSVSIELNIEDKFLSDDLVFYCKKFNISAQEMALSGGEDYELLFTCPPALFEKIKHLLPEAYKVGTCLPFNGSFILNPPVNFSSFIHR